MSRRRLPTFTHHNANSTESIIDDVITPLCEATHADVIDDPFYSAERFAQRVRGYANSPGFELVVAEIDGAPVGLAFGYALPPPRDGGTASRRRSIPK